MGKNRKAKLPKNGGEWLRLLFENRLFNVPQCVLCNKCGAVNLSERKRCGRCGGETKSIDWKMVSASIRRAYQKDKSLVRRVVWDYLGARHQETRSVGSLPEFPGALSWLNGPVRKAHRPQERPFEIYEIFLRVEKILQYRNKIKAGMAISRRETDSWAAARRERTRLVLFWRHYRSNPKVRLSGKRIRNKKSVKKHVKK